MSSLLIMKYIFKTIFHWFLTFTRIYVLNIVIYLTINYIWVVINDS